MEWSGKDMCGYACSVNIVIVISELDVCMRSVAEMRRSLCDANVVIAFSEFDYSGHACVLFQKSFPL